MAAAIALISGASRGIGLATAKLFVAQGFAVYNLSRSPANVIGVNNIAIDLSDAACIDTLAKALNPILSQASRICMVHNAAILEKDSAAAIESQAFARVMQLNVIAPALLNQWLLPFMGPTSAIVYIGSTLSSKGVPNTCSYVTSKHALLGLMRASVQDLVGSGVLSFMVKPGFTNTEMLREHVGGDPEILADIAKGMAMQRLAEPEEIARIIVFGVDNPVLNGAEIDANLGQIEH